MDNVKARQWARLLALVASLVIIPAASATASTDAALPAYTQAEWNAQLGLWRSEVEQARRKRVTPGASSAQDQTTVLTNEQIAKIPVPQDVTSVALLAPGTASASDTLDAVAVGSAESITNVQTAGVDEGGIVKQHGRHLVVLRRGRLFSIDVQGGALRKVSAVDAFGPGFDPKQGWYDEMLISGNTIVVVGFNYSEGATGIGLFDIDDAGAIRYRDTYFLRSDDYYSSSNSASRLIGQTLIFYTPIHLQTWRTEMDNFFPSLGRRAAGAKSATYVSTLPVDRIYRTRFRPMKIDDAPTLHVVTRCDLSQPDMRCESSAALGPRSREFYVSQDAAYVWTTDWQDDDDQPAPSSVIRLPLDGSAPSQLQTRGGPIDQLSFLQDGEGNLNVLLVAQSRGDGMWSSEMNGGDAALLRVPLSAFGGLQNAADKSHYRPLPRTVKWGAHNRFVGDWLIYSGDIAEDSKRMSAPVYALRYARNEPVQTLGMPFAVERIEVLGGNALLAGQSVQGDLYFTSVRLEERASVVSTFIQPDAAQGESRTHGFFYKAQDADTGILGLPIKRATAKGMDRYLDDSAGVVYLRNRALMLSTLGQLDAAPITKRHADDGCKASCVDWYGNARPIFLGDRVFALLGYELVEGQVVDERIRERRRVDFTPSQPRR